jgi:ParB/RepB/Spo0J family partition protein
MPTTKILERIPLSAIVAGDNDRTVFDPSAVESLAAAISAVGLVQPITVRPRGNGTYEIVAGERRYRAVESLGWEMQRASCSSRTYIVWISTRSMKRWPTASGCRRA